MFRRRHQAPEPPSCRHSAPQAASGNQDQLIPVLTQAEVFAVVNLLEEGIRLSTSTESADLASTLIVRLLDRLPATEAGT